jgi:hypothetical protein
MFQVKEITLKKKTKIKKESYRIRECSALFPLASLQIVLPISLLGENGFVAFVQDMRIQITE